MQQTLLQKSQNFEKLSENVASLYSQVTEEFKPTLDEIGATAIEERDLNKKESLEDFNELMQQCQLHKSIAVGAGEAMQRRNSIVMHKFALMCLTKKVRDDITLAGAKRDALL